MATDNNSNNNKNPGMQGEEPDYLLADIGNEVVRLQKQHAWTIKGMDNQVIFAPLDTSREGLKVLDMACADGTLLREISTRLPKSAQFAGIDLMVSFLPRSAASNFRYLAQDVLTPLPADMQSSFDLVNVRLMFVGVWHNASVAVRNLVDGLAPGGWLQVMEMLTTWHPDATRDGEAQGITDVKLLTETLMRGLGITEEFPLGLEKLFKEEGGLENVSVKVVNLPVGRSMGDDEALQKLSVEPFDFTIESVIGGCEKIGAKLPASVTDNLRDRFVKDAMEHGGHFPMVVVTGQKPQA